ncbi:RNA methyltransferase [Hymenobacter koreensis]|uniref:RNA methyltransferase n=1 Tax=Hymenobacter koreensis TaxID=1084523 RepID=A0ABP8IZQ6_9BACT
MRKLTIQELNRHSVEDFKNTEKFPLCVVLDNVRSLHNVGAAFRTCDAFAVQKLWLGGITGRPPHRDITKTALGSTESVPWEHAPNVPALVQQLKQEGWQVVAVEQTNQSILLPEFRPVAGKPLALVFGNEVFGVDDEVLAVCDAAVEIPQFGTKHSLNVSVTVGVVLWDAVSKLTTFSHSA